MVLAPNIAGLGYVLLAETSQRAKAALYVSHRRLASCVSSRHVDAGSEYLNSSWPCLSEISWQLRVIILPIRISEGVLTRVGSLDIAPNLLVAVYLVRYVPHELLRLGQLKYPS